MYTEKSSPSIVNTYLDTLTDVLSKAPAWKYVALALHCVTWEYGVYTSLVKDCLFDMSKPLKKSIDRFWAAAATGYSMDEKYLLAMEESRFQPRDDFETLALSIVEDLIAFFYAVYDKDKNNLLTLCQRQLDRLQRLGALLEKSPAEVLALQSSLCAENLAYAKRLSLVATQEKKAYLDKSAKQPYPLPLAVEIAKHRTLQKKEKPVKRALPELRPISLDIEYAIKRQLPEHNPKNMTPEELLFCGDGTFHTAYVERHYCDLCHYMSVKYQLCAESDFRYNQDPAHVLGWWYMLAKTTLYSWKLFKKGFPIHFGNVKYDLNHEREWRRQHLVMLCAYAAGADELLAEICSFENPKGDAKKLLSILTGNAKAQQYELAKPWQNLDGKALDAILRKDEKAFRQCILQMIRADRKGYDLCATTLDIYAYAYLRFAKECGLQIERVNAIEVLFGNLEVSIDRSQWKLAYEDEILEFLESH